jgi:4-amino-4-deoxy-L-arabinose transferase-like glycosyltransferase
MYHDTVDLAHRPQLPPELPRARRPPRAGWPATWWKRLRTADLVTLGIGILAAVLYIWALNSVGWGNSYYAAAVKAGTKSWKAFFFGAIDPGSFITVDKPPAALWVQEISARIFGFSSWSMLLPEAAAGVASVLVLHRLVRRWAGDLAAHLSALALALTPVAVMMFRFNNPDAFLTLLCLLAAWALWSAGETGRTRWLLVSAALVGLAFDTKMLQAFLVLPAFVLVYLIAGPARLAKRLAQLAAAAVTLVVAGGWWVAIVAAWPAASRPYIGSTTNNSIASLIFGYNGLSRLFGGTGTPGGGGGTGGANFGGAAGWTRLFNSIVGGQISWLIPLAVAGLAAGLWLTRRGHRADRGRAGWLLWGLWGAVCVAVFSLSKGIFHPYYTVQLAPAVAALAGAGGVALNELGRRHRASLGWVLPVAVVVTTGWAAILLSRTAGYDTWLRTAVMAGGLLAGAGLWVAFHLPQRLLLAGAAGLATVALLAGPAAYAATTIANGDPGVNALAGPATSGAFGGARLGGAAGPAGGAAGGAPGAAGGAPGAAGGSASTSTDAGLIAYLEANRDGAEYIVAAFGSGSSGPIIIDSGQPVITIGGFNGSDPAPTLAGFEKLVAEGKVRYVLVSGSSGGFGGGGPGGVAGGPGGGNSTTQSISSWVTSNGKAVPAAAYGSSSAGTLYDVSGAA